MPTLSAWDGPFVAVDIKGDLEAHYLQSPKNGREIIVLNPDDPDSLSVDPFEWLDDDGEDNLLSNLTAMSAIIIPQIPQLPDPFWAESERSVLTAALLC